MKKEKRRRIIVASHAWADDMVGGAFKVATDWSEFLAQQGHDVHYLCGEASDSRERTIRGVKIHSYLYPRQSGFSALKHHVSESARCAEQIAAEGEVDAIVGHSPLQYQGALRSVGASPVRMYSVHSPFADEIGVGSSAWKGFVQRRIAKLIDRQCIRQSTIVTTFSEFTLSRLKQHFGPSALSHGTVCPAWVDTSRFSSDYDQVTTRTHLGDPWQSDDTIFMTLRRLESRMGIDQLIHAAKIVTEAGYRFRLMIAGDGSLRSSLQALIEDLSLESHVKLLGRIEDHDLAAVYSASDCFVLPTTRLECFGLIILESYSCGVPVIATPVAAIPEIIRQHSSDWLTRDTSANAIADRMIAFLDREIVASPTELQRIASGYEFETRARQLEQAAFQGLPHVTTAAVESGA